MSIFTNLGGGSGGGGGDNPFDQELNQTDSPVFASLYTPNIYNDGDSSLAIDVANRGLLALDGTTTLINFDNSTTGGAYYFNAGVLVGDGSQLTGISPFDQTLNIADAPTFSAIHISTIYDLNESLGTTGQFLSSDGASAVWADAPNPFDQTLNVGDNVEFNQVNTLFLGVTSGGGAGWNILEDGKMYIDGSYGTTGQVLTSNGNAATCSWADAPNPFDQTLNVGDNVTFVDVSLTRINSQTFPASAGTAGHYLSSDGTDCVWAPMVPSFPIDIAVDSTIFTSYTGAFDIFRLGADGSPAFPVGLSINGINYPASAGTAGQVVTSDGTNFNVADISNIFDQDLNSGDSVGFGSLSVATTALYADGSIAVNSSSGSSGQFLMSQGPEVTAVWAGASDIADGTYTVGIGTTTDGTITFVNGRITAIQEAT